jgi:hypothetical protein
MDVTKLIQGPAKVKYRGARLESQGNVSYKPIHRTWQPQSARFGSLPPRSLARLIEVRFTPVGEWKDLAVLYRNLQLPYGSLLTPMYTVSGVVTGDDELTITGHGIVEGTGVRLSSTGTMPGGVSATTTYFVGVEDADTITLHTTEAAALAGTGKVDITSAGSGVLRVVENTPLIIHGEDGTVLTVLNAMVTSMPNIGWAPTRTMFDEVVFTGLLLNRTTLSDANNIYTVGSAPFSDDSFDPDLILSTAPTCSWGASAPWSEFGPEDVIQISFTQQNDEKLAPGSGLYGFRIGDRSVTVTMVPLEITDADLKAKAQIEGLAHGAPLAFGDDLDIAGPGDNPFIRIYDPALTDSGGQFGTGDNRIGQLTWTATQTLTAGTRNALAYIGTEPPA